jgi:hypothetical protein
MKINLYILALLAILLVSCLNQKNENKIEIIETDSLNEIHHPSRAKLVTQDKFQIEKFRMQSDSLLKLIKGEKYGFEILTDTIDLDYRNKESRKFKVGMFWHLQGDSITEIIRHYIYAPKTKKMFRIYLNEVTFSSKKALENKMSELFVSMLDSMPCGFDCDYFVKVGLTPGHDYITTANNKLYWMNLYYPYKRSEFHQFVSCLKSNIDTLKFEGRIICYFGGEYKNKNVP